MGVAAAAVADIAAVADAPAGPVQPVRRRVLARRCADAAASD